MTVIVGGSDLAAIYAAGEAGGQGGRAAVLDFCGLVRELSGEEPEYGDSVEMTLGDPLGGEFFGAPPAWPDRRPSNPERED